MASTIQKVQITDPLEAFVHLGYHEMDARSNKALELRMKAFELNQKAQLLGSNEAQSLRDEASRLYTEAAKHMDVAWAVVKEMPNRMNDVSEVARTRLYDLRHGTHMTFYEHTLLGRFISYLFDKFASD